MSRKPSGAVQLKLRFSERLRARIEAAAAKNERSMNSEIVRRLEQSFEREDREHVIQATATATATALASHWGIVSTPGGSQAHTHQTPVSSIGSHSVSLEDAAKAKTTKVHRPRKKKP